MSAPQMTKLQQRMFLAKDTSKLSFQQIGDAIGCDEIFTAAIFYGQAKPTLGQIEKLSSVLNVPNQHLVEELGSNYFPSRGGIMSVPPTDPILYRFYEMIQVYGCPLKAVINEKFGDGIMSAVDFKAHVDKVQDPSGDRVKITFDELVPVELTNKYDSTQLKNAVDDEISRFYSKEKGFVQSHKNTDIKLILGYVSCLIAGGSFYYEYKTSFHEAIDVTTVCVVVFWTLQLILTGYIYFIEKNEIFSGNLYEQGKPSAALKVSGKLKKYTSEYPLTITYTDTQLKKSATLKFKPNVTTWFTTKGSLERSVADKDLASFLDSLQKTLHQE